MAIPQGLLSTLGLFSSGSGIVSDLAGAVNGIFSIIEYLGQLAGA